MGDPLREPTLTHLDESGQVHMVDIAEKSATARRARASARVRMRPETLALMLSGEAPKGDVNAVCRVAGIMAAKKTSDLIPLCHPLALSKVQLELVPRPPDAVELIASVACNGPTGVEMEALTAVSVAALTLYDMLKAVDRAMEIGPIVLLQKEGGRSGNWQRD